jgi:hypothetical protein
MNTKTLLMIGVTVGSFLGSYVPVIFGADPFGVWSILGGAVGGFAGIWGGWKLAHL